MAAGRGRVVVIASVNVDHVVTTRALPTAGQTTTGGIFARHPGGKGANQAVAAARWGADVAVVGAVGDDPDGAWALDALRAEGVDVAHVATVDAPTGVALVVVDAGGENQIAVAPGANDAVAVPAGWRPVGADGVLLCGFEVPDAAVVASACGAAAAGWRTVLVPAPARPLPAGLPAGILLCPNAGEAAALTGVEDDPEAAGRALAARTGGAVVITLGARGALVVADGAGTHVAAPEHVEPIDTTGAGDTLAGVLAAELAAGSGLVEATRTAVGAASRSTAVAGARDGMPRRLS